MASFLENLAATVGGFASRSIKFAEAALLNDAVAKIQAAENDLEPLVASEAPASAAELISAVQKAVSSVLGSVNGAFVNAIISSDASGIEAELASLLAIAAADVEGYVATFLAALKVESAKLQAFALAEK